MEYFSEMLVKKMQKVFFETLWKVDILSCFLNLLVNETFNIFIITDKIWSNKIDGLIKIQISEWQQHFDILDKDGDGNGQISISIFIQISNY